jgi:hypothetical protein
MDIRIQKKTMLRKVRKKRKFKKRKPPQEMKRTQLGGEGLSRAVMERVDADVAIDRSKLDLENARQTKLFEKYNKKYMEVLEKKLIAEEIFNGKKATMAGDIRSNPKEFGLDKITEGAVQLALPNHPDYEAAHREYLNHYLAYDYYLGVIENISKRPTLLSNLGRLIEVGYWTRTSMSQDEYLEEEK